MPALGTKQTFDKTHNAAIKGAACRVQPMDFCGRFLMALLYDYCAVSLPLVYKSADLRSESSGSPVEASM